MPPPRILRQKLHLLSATLKSSCCRTRSCLLIDPQLRLGQSPHPHTRCAVKRTVVDRGPWAKVEQNVAKQRRHAQYTSDSNSAIKNVATKEHKRQAKALVE